MATLLSPLGVDMNPFRAGPWPLSEIQTPQAADFLVQQPQSLPLDEPVVLGNLLDSASTISSDSHVVYGRGLSSEQLLGLFGSSEFQVAPAPMPMLRAMRSVGHHVAPSTSGMASPPNNTVSNLFQFLQPQSNMQQQYQSQQVHNGLLIGPQTDVVQAASMAVLSLSQPGAVNFALNPQAAVPGIPGSDGLGYALEVALCARKLSTQGGGSSGRSEVGFIPAVSTDFTGVEQLSLLLYRYRLPDGPRPRAQVFKLDHSSNIVLAGLSLFSVLQSGNSSTAEVVFSPSCTQVALQTLAVARANLTGNHLDMLVFPQVIEWSSTPDAAAACSSYHLKLVLVHHVMPSVPVYNHSPSINQQQNMSIAGARDLAALLKASGISTSSDRGMGRRTSSGTMSSADAASPASSVQSIHLSHQGLNSQAQHSAAAIGGGPKARARKADYVIVTEDTAIKNAAGAVAKVLGRVAGQGLCCPVYTEKKTDSYTQVVSVAVKAIAVARGYVCNEGTGQEVAFQPYIRSPEVRSQLNAADLHQYVLEKKVLQQLQSQGLPAVIRSVDNMESAVEEDDPSWESLEMAFDVFKVPALSEQHDATNLPVKVTAHSRSSVVSNIITKLVAEKDSAVLITAGGKAMQVAMAAVISARARLKHKGMDIVLLPKFVTVDTTTTLGWESVFLKFNIVRWAPAIISDDTPGLGAVEATPSKFIIAPAAC